MKLKNLAVLAAFAATASLAQATTSLSFTGNFTYDNDVQKFTFTVDSDTDVTLRSWSYAGGVNAAGQTIARGGFDPILTLFDAAGNFIDNQDDAGCPAVPSDAVTGSCWDVNLTDHLAAGTYTVSIQQFNNFALGNLADGYAYDGADYRNFRNGFYDVTGNKRDGHWAFDILNVTTAAQDDPPPAGNIPEPASLALLGVGAAGLAALRRRR